MADYKLGGFRNTRTGNVSYFIRKNGRIIRKGFKTQRAAIRFAKKHARRTEGFSRPRKRRVKRRKHRRQKKHKKNKSKRYR